MLYKCYDCYTGSRKGHEMVKDRYSVRLDDEVVAMHMLKSRIANGWKNVDIEQSGRYWILSYDAKQPEIWRGMDK